MTIGLVKTVEICILELQQDIHSLLLIPKLQWHEWSLIRPKKKNCYIGVTRPTLKLGPTLHFFLNQKKKNDKKKWPTDPWKSKTCDLFV